ncbi:lithostathine-1-beta-like [Centropristis striata]|uniref:lithostathine-1-beta-like n=1 Tax=Centropristis striata TaxID=184440 RepID=UPI0027E01FA6|nr:lithostathine-1-beta-like [Centropristis striata]
MTDKLILIKEKKTWEDALNYCRHNHRDLVSITNPHQQRWVQERAKQADSDLVWLGLSYSCFLDLWFWVNDNVVCYDKWDSKEPEGRCDKAAAMKKGGEHEWVSKFKTEKFNFICTLKQV